MAREDLCKLAAGMLRYRYVLDEDEATAVEVFTLAEIALPYKQRFKDEIADQNWIVEFGRKLEESPHKADFVICTADAAI